MLLYLFYSYVNCMQIEKVGDLLPAPREEAILSAEHRTANGGMTAHCSALCNDKATSFWIAVRQLAKDDKRRRYYMPDWKADRWLDR